MLATPALELDGLNLTISGRPLLRGFSLELARGQRVVLTGGSGRGKSTLLRCILGLVVPQGGSIRVDGETLNTRTVWRLRRRMAYVPQELTLGEGSVRGWLEAPFAFRANRGLHASLARVPQLMAALGLPESLLDGPAARLSGGEKRRIALISALLLDRPILLLDEPTSGLDEPSVQRVRIQIDQLVGRSVLAVTHDPQALGADSVVAIEAETERPS